MFISKQSEATNENKRKKTIQFLILVYWGISLSVLLFSFFSIGDQAFGDRFTLLEQTIFWIILLFSWAVFKYYSMSEERIFEFSYKNGLSIVLAIGTVLTLITSYSIVIFSDITHSYKIKPIHGIEVADGVYKFDFPSLGDKLTMEKTIKSFKEENPKLSINYIYTGPEELNTKKKTHMLLYVFKGAKE